MEGERKSEEGAQQEGNGAQQELSPEEKRRIVISFILRVLFYFFLFLVVVCLILYIVGFAIVFTLILVFLLPYARSLLPSSLSLFYVMFIVWLQCHFYIPDSSLTFVIFVLTFGGGALLNWRLVGLAVGLVEALSYVGMMSTGWRLWRIGTMGWRKLKRNVEVN